MTQAKLNLQLRFAKRKHLYNLLLLSVIAVGTLCAYWYWYATPTTYTAQASISIKGEQTPSDFWTNTGLVAATTRATQVISSETFVSSVFDSTDTPAETYVKVDHRKITSSANYPFDIIVKKRSEQGRYDYTITDAGDSSYLLKSVNNGASTLATFGQLTDIDGFTIIVSRKPNQYTTPKSYYVPAEFGFAILSNNDLAYELLKGDYDLTVSQINDVVKVSVTSEGDLSSAKYANLIAAAYLKTLKNEDTQASATHPITETPANTQDKAIESDARPSIQLDELAKLEEQKELQDQLTRNIREHIEEDFSGISLNGVASENIERNLDKLAALYAKLDHDPKSESIQEQIKERKKRITDELIEIRKETAEKIEALKNDMQDVNITYAPIPKTTSPDLANGNHVVSESEATLIEATPLTTEANTSIWMWISVIGTLLTMVMIRKVAALASIVQMAKADATNEEVNNAPTLISVVRSNGRNASPIEPVQNLCTEILSHKNAKLIAFSSLNSGEGKTFVTTRLAMALASLDKKVLVLDLAMSNPSVEKVFDVHADTTFADVMMGKNDVLQSVQQTSIPGLDIIGAGNIKHGVMGLLSWKDNESTVLQLKNYYDYILVDTDGFSQGPGSLAIMKWCDLSLIIDASQGSNHTKSINLSKIIDKKNLINTFVVFNEIKERKETKKPSKKTNKTIEINTEDPDSTHTIDDRDNSVDEQTKKPSFLKRVALWFF